MAANQIQPSGPEIEIKMLLDSCTPKELLETLIIGKNIIKVMILAPRKNFKDEKVFNRVQVLEDIKSNLQKLKSADRTDGLDNVTEQLRRAVEILKGYEDDMEELNQIVQNDFIPVLTNSKKAKKKELVLEHLGGYEVAVTFIQGWLKTVALSVVHLDKGTSGEENAVQKLLEIEICASTDRVVSRGDELLNNLKLAHET